MLVKFKRPPYAQIKQIVMEKKAYELVMSCDYKKWNEFFHLIETIKTLDDVERIFRNRVQVVS